MISAALSSSVLVSSITPFTTLFWAVLSSRTAAAAFEEVFLLLMGFTSFFFDIWHLRKQILIIIMAVIRWFAGNSWRQWG